MSTNAHDLAKAALTPQRQSSTASLEAKQVEALPLEWVDRIFARLMGTFGHKFMSQFADERLLDIAKGEWAEGCARLSATQIARALTKARNFGEWQPTVAGFLRMACDLPNLETCTARVIKGDNRDEVSYRISAVIGSHALSTLTNREIERRVAGHFPDMYEKVLLKTMGQDEAFQPAVRITNESEPEATYADPSLVSAEIAKMKSTLQREQA